MCYNVVMNGIRKVTSKERQRAGNIYCSFCRPNKVHAIWRVIGFASPLQDFACEEHKKLIRIDTSDRLTEADLQTWMRL